MRDALGAALAAAALAFAAVALTVGIDDGADGESRAQRSARAGAQLERDSGRAIFARMGCGSCHTLAAAGSKGQFGPDLDSRLEHHTRATPDRADHGAGRPAETSAGCPPTSAAG